MIGIDFQKSLSKNLQIVDRHLQNFFQQSVNTLLNWLPSPIIEKSSALFESFTILLSNKILILKACKLPLEKHDKRFYNTILILAFDEIDQALAQKTTTIEKIIPRVVELQSLLGKQTASPFLYYQLLRSLKRTLQQNHFSTSVQIQQIMTSFKKELKDQPDFTKKSYEGDLAILLQEWCQHKMTVQTLMNSIKFYVKHLPPVHGFNLISHLENLVTEKEANLLTALGTFEEYLFLKNFLTKTSDQLLSKHLHIILEAHAARKKIVKQTANISEDDNVPLSKYFYSGLKLLKNSMYFSINHPLETTLIILFAQVTIVGALRPIKQIFDNEKNHIFLDPTNKSRDNVEHTFSKKVDTQNVPPESKINNQTVNAMQPSIVANGTQFSVLFSANDNSGLGDYGRFFSWNGQATKPEFPINQYYLNNQTNPVAIFQNNEYRVFWQNYNVTNYDIMYGRFDSNWNSISQSPFQTNRLYDQMRPQVAASPMGACIVWEHSFDGSGWGIVSRCIGLNGVPLGTDNFLNVYFLTGDQIMPDIAASKDFYLVVWQSADGDGSGTAIVGMNMDFNGVRQSSRDTVINSNTAGDQLEPTIATNSTIFLVSFKNGNDIYARFVTPTLQFIGADFRISSKPCVHNSPQAAFLHNGNFLICYQSNPNGNFDIRCQEISNGGALVGNEIQVNTNANGDKVKPYVFAAFPFNDPKNFAVLWEDPSAVFMRIFNNTSLEPPLITTGPVTTASLTTGLLTTGYLTTNLLTTDSQGSSTTDTLTTLAAPTTYPSTTNIGLTSEQISDGSDSTSHEISTGTTTTNDFVSSTETKEETLFATSIEVTRSESTDRTENTATTQLIGVTTSQSSALDITSLNKNSHSSPDNTTPIIIGVSVASGLVTLGLFGAGFYCYKKKYARRSQMQNEQDLFQLRNYTYPSDSIEGDIKTVVKIPKKVTPTLLGEYMIINEIDDDIKKDLEAQTGFEIKLSNKKDEKNYEIGHGEFSKFKIAKSLTTGKFLGVKKLKSGYENVNEIKIHKELSQEKNIMPILDVLSTEDNRLYLFMPIAGFGTGLHLRQSLAALKDQELKQKILMTVLYQLINGLSNMHNYKIYHNDIKPENFVLDNELNLYIIDFGCAKKNDECPYLNHKDVDGDHRYFSSDRLFNLSFHARHNDLWAAGVTMLEIAIGKYPFNPNMYPNQRKIYCTPEYFQDYLNPLLQNNNNNSVFKILKEDLLRWDMDRPTEIEILTKIKQQYPRLLLTNSELPQAFAKLRAVRQLPEYLPPPNKNSPAARKEEADNYTKKKVGSMRIESKGKQKEEEEVSFYKEDKIEIKIDPAENGMAPRF